MYLFPHLVENSKQNDRNKCDPREKIAVGFWNGIKKVKLLPVEATGTRKLYIKTQFAINSQRKSRQFSWSLLRTMNNIVLSWIQQSNSKQGCIGQCYSHGACSHGIPNLLRISKFLYHCHKHPHLIPIQRKTIQSTTSNPISSRSNLILSPTYANVYQLDSSLLTLSRAFVVSYTTHTQPMSLLSEHLIKTTNFEAPHPV
jgi:hypothetical protein